MYAYAVQQEDIDILRQTTKITYAKVELMNHDMQVVNTIEGHIFNDNFSLDGDSAIRRTYTCSIVVSDDMFVIGKDRNIWADRFIRVYYGIKHSRRGDIIWYLLGTFSFVDMSYQYSTTEKTLSLTCSDMMSFYNGTKSGVVLFNTQSEAKLVLEVGLTFDEVIKTLCNEAGIKYTNITGLEGYTLPHDMEFGAGTTYYEVWSQLSELYPIWDFFFDEYGTFVWRKKPNGLNDNTVLDDVILKPLVVNESLNDSFQNIYNVVEVWGKNLDLANDDRYIENPGDVTEDEEGYNTVHIKLYDGCGQIITKATKFVGMADFKGPGHKLVLENTSEDEPLDLKYTFYQYVDDETGEEFAVTLAPKQKLEIPVDEKAVAKIIVTDELYTEQGLAYMSVGWMPDGESGMSFEGKLLDLDNFSYLAMKMNTDRVRYININGLQSVPVLNASGMEYNDDTFEVGKVYVFCYRRTAEGFSTKEDPIYPNFYKLGQFQAHGYYEETNNKTPYSIDNLGYKSVKVIEMQNLYDDDACQERAMYEAYQATAKQDTMTLTTMIIPFLEPNQKISYTPFINDELGEWIIKNMSWSTMSGTMTMNIYRFLPEYEYIRAMNRPFIVDRSKLDQAAII